MKNKFSTAQIVASLTLALSTACTVGDGTIDIAPESGAAPKFALSKNPIPGRYIVVLNAPKSLAARSLVNVGSVTSQLASGFAAKVKQTWSGALHGFSAEMSEADAKALSNDPRVALVEQDGIVKIDATQTGATWGLDRIDQVSLPLDGTYTSAADGTGVNAYIIDTGINPAHGDFGGRVTSGFTAINDGQGTVDCNGHGSHVAGTVGGATWGVAKNVNLVAVRVLDCNGSGSNSGVIDGINWVAQNHTGPSVINMSLGGGASAATDEAVKNAVASGVTVVVAAGNDNKDACTVSPARAAEAITVGATTNVDGRSSFSNFGTCLDIFAPGSNITSVDYKTTNGSMALSGTSMAAPHVAGAAVLYLSANTGATPAQVASGLLGAAVSDKISDARGSANKFLNVGEGGGGGGGGETPPPPPGTGPGTPSQGSSDSAVSQGSYIYYNPLNVVPGSSVTVTLSGTGDADLYLQFGGQPTTTTFACASESETADEVCVATVPAGQSQAFIGVYGYTDSTFHLEASWTAP